MKTSIPSDVWEKKKALIARLYKDEEWPLKQVIKQIRTEDFNPSETQLRSRLKKWRVTKPSRQTRKKPADGPADNDDDEDDVQDEMSPVETKNIALQTPTPQPQPAVSHQDAAPARDWFSSEWAQLPPQQQQHQPQRQSPPQLQPEPTPTVQPEQAEIAVTSPWSSAPVSAAPQLAITTEHHVQQNPASQINTPVVSHFPPHGLSAAYDLSQQSPQTTVPTTHMVSPTYVASYPMAQISYPQSAPASAIQWPTATDYIEPDVSPSGMAMPPTNWFTAQYDATSGAPPTAYYQRAVNPMASNYSHMMQPMAPQDMGSSYQPQQHMAGFQGFDENGAIRPWRRAMSSQFHPEAAPGHVRVDRQGRQRKQVMDRKRKDSGEEMNNMALQQPLQQPVQSAHHAMQAVMPPQYIAAGHHSMMPHDIYAFAGHEQLLQRPIGH
ncbi:hypothetical protein PISL3812_08572 [Talaromyces islandicus]|uniref:Clr5 domain-containing protein n=1 Tax=Talaromyces islandicus TaxID=28573 RepID=A0A0U1M798_TALIS|nr:hypothetical protein PISL3812_08572 [Talaromyces islandicus]